MFQDCTLEGKTYPSGSEICRLLLCMICQQGQWEERKNYSFAALVGQPFCRGIRPI